MKQQSLCVMFFFNLRTLHSIRWVSHDSSTHTSKTADANGENFSIYSFWSLFIDSPTFKRYSLLWLKHWNHLCCEIPTTRFSNTKTLYSFSFLMAGFQGIMKMESGLSNAKSPERCLSYSWRSTKAKVIKLITEKAEWRGWRSCSFLELSGKNKYRMKV